MPLHHTQRKEKILLMGPYNSGKSWCWKSIAEWLEKTNAPGRLWVADTDWAWEGQRPYDGSLDARVVQENIADWSSLMAFCTKAHENYEDGDWLILDMWNKLWEMVQNYFTTEMFGKDAGAYFMEARKAGGNFGGEYGVNWQVVKKLYEDFKNLVTMRWPGHLLACTAVSEVRQAGEKGGFADSRDVINLFGKLGVKPEGEKMTGYLFHTVLLLQDVPRVGRTFTSAKDRSREEVQGQELTDFVRSYLIPIAGWEMV